MYVCVEVEVIVVGHRSGSRFASTSHCACKYLHIYIYIHSRMSIFEPNSFIPFAISSQRQKMGTNLLKFRPRPPIAQS